MFLDSNRYGKSMRRATNIQRKLKNNFRMVLGPLGIVQGQSWQASRLGNASGKNMALRVKSAPRKTRRPLLDRSGDGAVSEQFRQRSSDTFARVA